MPSALSSASEPVDMTGTLAIGRLPSFMMDPLPNCRSTWTMALSRAFCLSVMVVMSASFSFNLGMSVASFLSMVIPDPWRVI